MKVIQIADLHISDSRMLEFEEMVIQLADKIKEQNSDLIVFAGDLFVHRDRLSPKQVELARKLFKEYLAGHKIISIPGNHDTSMSENKVDSLSAIFSQEDSPLVVTEIGRYEDIENTRFHFFPYPSKVEMVRLGIDGVDQLFRNEMQYFTIDSSKKNVLIFHGTMEGFAYTGDYEASESAIGIGAELVISKDFYERFDAVMAGHLHKYQVKGNAIYCGAPFPLTFFDNYSTGFVLWDDLKPEFVKVDNLYPFLTYDVGNLSKCLIDYTKEAIRRIGPVDVSANSRIRIKYLIDSTKSGLLKHVEMCKVFGNVKDIKVSPSYIESGKHVEITSDEFKSHKMSEIIETYIDKNKYSPKVKEIATKVDKMLSDESSELDDRGINFVLGKLKLENYRSFSETEEIDFTKLAPLVGIFGKNKAGKSSLVEAIIWCLFGQTHRSKDKAQVIKSGTDLAKVSLSFYSYDEHYQIIRTRGKNAGTLKLFKFLDKWVDISGGTALTTQKIINKIAGSFDIFSATIYAPQNKIDLLIEATPSKRKEIILDCLQIDVLEKRQEIIRRLKADTKESVDRAKGASDIYAVKLEKLMTSKPSAALTKFEDLLTDEKLSLVSVIDRKDLLSKSVDNYLELRAQDKEINEELTKLRKETSTLYEVIRSKKTEKDRMEAIASDSDVVRLGVERLHRFQREIENYIDEMNRNSERRAQIKKYENTIKDIMGQSQEVTDALVGNRDKLTRALDNLSLLDCDRPDCPLNAKIGEQKEELVVNIDSIDSEMNTVNNQRELEISRIKENIIRVEEELNASFYDNKKHMEYATMCKEEKNKKWEELYVRQQAGDDIVLSVIEVITAYQNQYAMIDKRKAELVIRRSDIAQRTAAIDQTQREILNATAEIHGINKKIDNYQNQVYKLKKDIEEINELQENLSVQNKKIGRLEDDYQHCIKYQEIVSKSGVIYSIVDKAIPTMERFAQNLLSEVAGGIISVHMDSYKMSGRGVRADEVSIYISDAKGKRDASSASGAEKVLLALVLRAAMSHLLSLRMNSNVELFILDEGMGAFDDENKIIAKNMIKKLSSVFKKVLIITHVEEMKDIAQSIIHITSNGIDSFADIIEDNK